MPIYEYICPKCGRKFQRRRSFSQCGEAVSCPDCDSPAEKQLSAFAAMSRGDGGTSVPIAGGGCSSCSSGSCSTCGG